VGERGVGNVEQGGKRGRKRAKKPANSKGVGEEEAKDGGIFSRTGAKSVHLKEEKGDL